LYLAKAPKGAFLVEELKVRRRKMKKIPPESNLIEWKKSPVKEVSNTMVAMSNSIGGRILIGVDEVKDKKGEKKARVVGYKLAPGEKLKIQSFAENCIPKIDVEIKQLKNFSKPVVVIEIPEGKDKPYCTGGGKYLFREDGKNKAIDPSRMKRIFLEKESEEFLIRFKEAAKELEWQLDILGDKLGEIGNVADSAESLSDEAFTQADVAATCSEKALNEIEDIQRGIDSILVKLTNIEKDTSPMIRSAHRLLIGIDLIYLDNTRKNSKKALLKQLFNLRQAVRYFIQFRESESLSRVRKLYEEISDESLMKQRVLVNGKSYTLPELMNQLENAASKNG
jgi:hypothetical protein